MHDNQEDGYSEIYITDDDPKRPLSVCGGRLLICIVYCSIRDENFYECAGELYAPQYHALVVVGLVRNAYLRSSSKVHRLG